jgi:Flp pilus assembly pilin Flp
MRNPALLNRNPGLRRFLRDESGQATIEYVLILSVLVSIALLLIRDLLRPILTRFTDSLSKAIEERMFKPGSMHRSPFQSP